MSQQQEQVRGNWSGCTAILHTVMHGCYNPRSQITQSDSNYTLKMIRREVETKEKALKRTYREYREAWRAFLAYRRKKIEEIKLKKELKRAKMLLMDFHDGGQLFTCRTDL